jgi:dCTP deaminase
VRRIADIRADDPEALGIIPKPPQDDLEKFRHSGSASVDLRLGRWLLSLRQSRAALLEVEERRDKPSALSSAGALLLEIEQRVCGLEDGLEKRQWFEILKEAQRRGIEFDELNHELEIDELTRDSNRPERLARYHFVPFGDRFILHPGQFLLGITFEWLKFPGDLAGFVTGKSKWGRRGLIIETAAGIHPGFCGCLTLELGNVGPVPIPLIPGMEICQIFFERAEGAENVAQSQFDGRRRPVLGEIRLDRIVEKLQKPI